MERDEPPKVPAVGTALLILFAGLFAVEIARPGLLFDFEIGGTRAAFWLLPLQTIMGAAVALWCVDRLVSDLSSRAAGWFAVSVAALAIAPTLTYELRLLGSFLGIVDPPPFEGRFRLFLAMLTAPALVGATAFLLVATTWRRGLAHPAGLAAATGLLALVPGVAVIVLAEPSFLLPVAPRSAVYADTAVKELVPFVTAAPTVLAGLAAWAFPEPETRAGLLAWFLAVVALAAVATVAITTLYLAWLGMPAGYADYPRGFAAAWLPNAAARLVLLVLAALLLCTALLRRPPRVADAFA